MMQLLSVTLVILTMLNLLPQFLQVIKTKQTRDISLASFSIILSSAVLWVLYGVLNDDLTIVAANTVVAFFAASIVVIKVNYNKR